MLVIFRNIAGVIVGALAGGTVNMLIIIVGSTLIPSPAGAGAMDAETIARSIHLFEPKHFATPFLAHAAGTFVGALVGWMIAASYKTVVAYIIGCLFLIGGVAACFMIPAPRWFMALDLIAAYIPMAFLATIVGRRVQAT